MFLSMNWISDFVDFTGLDKVDLIHRFSLSTAEVENEIFFKGSDISGIVVAEIKSVENHPYRCQTRLNLCTSQSYLATITVQKILQQESLYLQRTDHI